MAESQDLEVLTAMYHHAPMKITSDTLCFSVIFLDIFVRKIEKSEKDQTSDAPIPTFRPYQYIS